MERNINWNKIITEIAQKDGVSPDEVRSAMEDTLCNAYSSQDPTVRQAWAKVPSKSDVPTLEEFLDYAAESVSKKRS